VIGTSQDRTAPTVSRRALRGKSTARFIRLRVRTDQTDVKLRSRRRDTEVRGTREPVGAVAGNGRQPRDTMTETAGISIELAIDIGASKAYSLLSRRRRTIRSRKPSALEACLAGSLGIGELVRLKSATAALAPDEAPPKAKKSPRPGHIRGSTFTRGVIVRGSDTEGRERLLRYCARPPLSLERTQVLPNGFVAYALRKPWGKQTHRVLTPLDFLARLAALIPPPRHPAQLGSAGSRPHLCQTRRGFAKCAISTG
jgi:putative transposase